MNTLEFTQEIDPTSIFEVLKKVEKLENINETYFFNFKQDDESVKYVTSNSALYISIKKAFTPYAVLHMLRQIQIAYSMKDQIAITEKFPLLFYIVENGNSKFIIKSDLS